MSSVNKALQKQILKKCANCNEKDRLFLNIHHKNMNREDNRIENLKVLCYRCHAKEHHKKTTIPKRVLALKWLYKNKIFKKLGIED